MIWQGRGADLPTGTAMTTITLKPPFAHPAHRAPFEGSPWAAASFISPGPGGRDEFGSYFFSEESLCQLFRHSR
jgi:hypothetical protein